MSQRVWPKHPFSRRLERKADELRQRLRLGDLSPLDPVALAQTFDNIILMPLDRLAGDRHPEEMARLRDESASWSAIAFRERGGPWLITWNPWHAETRTRASVTEEIAHIALKHEPTAMVVDELTGLP